MVLFDLLLHKAQQNSSKCNSKFLVGTHLTSHDATDARSGFGGCRGCVSVPPAHVELKVFLFLFRLVQSKERSQLLYLIGSSRQPKYLEVLVPDPYLNAWHVVHNSKLLC